jgi:hypothetical protein
VDMIFSNRVVKRDWQDWESGVDASLASTINNWLNVFTQMVLHVFGSG